MNTFSILAAGFSGLSFLCYGVSCLFSQNMRDEFERYNLVGFRKYVGSLQVVGAVGQLAGLWIPWFGVISSGGLALMMLAGVGVRVKLRDSFLQALPATVYCLLNFYVTLAFIRAIAST